MHWVIPARHCSSRQLSSGSCVVMSMLFLWNSTWMTNWAGPTFSHILKELLVLPGLNLFCARCSVPHPAGLFGQNSKKKKKKKKKKEEKKKKQETSFLASALTHGFSHVSWGSVLQSTKFQCCGTTEIRCTRLTVMACWLLSHVVSRQR